MTNQILTSLGEFVKKNQEFNPDSSATTNNLFGLNRTKVQSPIELNTDEKGYIFFTRPDLRLGGEVIRNDRKLYNLLNMDTLSMENYIRCTLDNYGVTNGLYNSPMVDNGNGFIPVLTNDLISCSGWPDETIPIYTSQEGIRKERIILVDGILDILSDFDLDFTFKNTKEEPIVKMINVWNRYATGVFSGKLRPYIKNELAGEIDFTVRAYRLITSDGLNKVTKIAAIGYGIWANNVNGKFYDLDESKPVTDGGSADINLRMKCVGAEYEDSISIREFNNQCAMFNMDYHNMVYGGRHNLVKIPAELSDIFNNRGLPYINPETNILEWYVDNSVVEEVARNLNIEGV